MSTTRTRPTPRGITPHQWRSGIAAWLGWFFDGLDMQCCFAVFPGEIGGMAAISIRAKQTVLRAELERRRVWYHDILGRYHKGGSSRSSGMCNNHSG